MVPRELLSIQGRLFCKAFLKQLRLPFRGAVCFVWPSSSGAPSTAELRLETPEVRRQCVGRNLAACIFGLPGWVPVNILIGHMGFCDQLYCPTCNTRRACGSPIPYYACFRRGMCADACWPCRRTASARSKMLQAVSHQSLSFPAMFCSGSVCVLQRRHCDTNAPAQHPPGTCSAFKRTLTVSAN